MCAEQRLERAAPRPGCSGLSLRAWGPQQRLAVSVAELCSEIRASGRRAILAVVSLPPYLDGERPLRVKYTEDFCQPNKELVVF